MIFDYYSRLAVKLGDGEKHVFDRGRLMYTEVAEIEKVTGLSYIEWEQQLRRYSITAVAALLHVLRKRDGQESDFGSMQFNAADLDCVPLHDGGTEFTPAEIAADLAARIKKAEAEAAGPTSATDGAVAPEASPQTSEPGTSHSSANGSASVPGNGTSSLTQTSSRARRTATRS